MLVLLQTVGQVVSPLVEVCGVEAVLAAVVAGLPVYVGAAVAVPALAHLEVGADEGLRLAAAHLHAGVGDAGVDHLRPAPRLLQAGHELRGLGPVLGSSPRPRQWDQLGRVGVSFDSITGSCWR